MPYHSVTDLPDPVRDTLPPHAESIYKEAFNSAYEDYASPSRRTQGGSREEVAHRVAWAAVKKSYHKSKKTGKWERGASDPADS